ncbi:MAG: hypothetical protein AB7F86_06865 [Bdellovibrionales bacterium]
MKKWEEILKEEPSQELQTLTETRVFQDMKNWSGSRRTVWWKSWAWMTAAFAGVFLGYRILREESTKEEVLFLELAEGDPISLEEMEDLDVIDILEELEEWTNS